MATHDWMKSEFTYDRSTERAIVADHAKRRPRQLEIALALIGVAAWIWCAYEVALAFLGR
ncbi:MAG: hypothetical protein ACHP84_05020 [Caulobacterales bacterium]|jgi:hypothetical protein